jgi:UDP:flavonoid glycosyltransferase YjiC (YdhE family)
MRVLVVTSGTMGDVAPYTGLATGLRDAGHDVTLATHAAFADAVAARGLAFRPLPGDLRTILPQARGQDGTRSGTSPVALAHLLRIAGPLIAELGRGLADVVAATRPQAILLSTLVAPLGYQVAEAAGVPWAGLFLQPVTPTGEFGPVLLGNRSVGSIGNRALAAAALTVSQRLYGAPVAALRARLGLPRENLRTLRRRQEQRWPTFHGFSPSVVPRPADWPRSHRVVGYWWPTRPAGWRPPADLVRFLDAGPPAVFVGFGSMAPGSGDRLAGPVLAAVRAAGVRAVVQAGWSGLTVDPPAHDVMSIGEVPHDWLFPRTAAVVHHAGAGTTAAGLRAGVPAVAVPVLADQPFWAGRLHALEVAPAPIPLAHLTAGRLARAIRQAVHNPRHRARAQAMAGRLATEDATTPILTWLNTLSPSP